MSPLRRALVDYLAVRRSPGYKLDRARLLHAGVDTSVMALWLGHEQVETTQIYLHAEIQH